MQYLAGYVENFKRPVCVFPIVSDPLKEKEQLEETLRMGNSDKKILVRLEHEAPDYREIGNRAAIEVSRRVKRQISLRVVYESEFTQVFVFQNGNFNDTTRIYILKETPLDQVEREIYKEWVCPD